MTSEPSETPELDIAVTAALSIDKSKANMARLDPGKRSIVISVNHLSEDELHADVYGNGFEANDGGAELVALVMQLLGDAVIERVHAQQEHASTLDDELEVEPISEELDEPIDGEREPDLDLVHPSRGNVPKEEESPERPEPFGARFVQRGRTSGFNPKPIDHGPLDEVGVPTPDITQFKTPQHVLDKRAARKGEQAADRRARRFNPQPKGGEER